MDFFYGPRKRAKEGEIKERRRGNKRGKWTTKRKLGNKRGKGRGKKVKNSGIEEGKRGVW